MIKSIELKRGYFIQEISRKLSEKLYRSLFSLNSQKLVGILHLGKLVKNFDNQKKEN